MNSESTPVTDDYDKEKEFVKAESLALFDYLRKSRSKGFVLSLSGGADSSCCAVLVSEMIRRGVRELGVTAFLNKLGLSKMQSALEGLSNLELIRELSSRLLITAYQGTVNSSGQTLQAASTLADSIGASFHEWKIDDEVGGYTEKIEAALRRDLTWERDDITLQNVQARARNPAIWMLANIHNALLLTTSNRSEGDVGYTTMDGDTSGSIAPIAGVDKYFLIQWLKWAEENLDYPGLHAVNQLSPSAELRPLEQTQTDEADLMPYGILVEIERLAIRDRNSPLEIYRIMKAEGLIEDSLLKSYITKFFRLWSRNQWKRERIAPSFHLDDFNVDPRSWCRFPILSGGYQEELAELSKL